MQFISHINTKYIFYTLISLIVSAGLLYGYFVHSAVSNIVERRQVKSTISSLNSQLGELEHGLIVARNDVTLQTAKELGFQEITNPRYLSLDRLDDKLVTFNDQATND